MAMSNEEKWLTAFERLNKAAKKMKEKVEQIDSYNLDEGAKGIVATTSHYELARIHLAWVRKYNCLLEKYEEDKKNNSKSNFEKLGEKLGVDIDEKKQQGVSEEISKTSRELKENLDKSVKKNMKLMIEKLENINMTNYELDQEANEIVETTSHYQLAKDYIKLFNKLDEVENTGEQTGELQLEDFHSQVKELVRKMGERGYNIESIQPRNEPTGHHTFVPIYMSVDYSK